MDDSIHYLLLQDLFSQIFDIYNKKLESQLSKLDLYSGTGKNRYFLVCKPSFTYRSAMIDVQYYIQVLSSLDFVDGPGTRLEVVVNNIRIRDRRERGPPAPGASNAQMPAPNPSAPAPKPVAVPPPSSSSSGSSPLKPMATSAAATASVDAAKKFGAAFTSGLGGFGKLMSKTELPTFSMNMKQGSNLMSAMTGGSGNKDKQPAAGPSTATKTSPLPGTTAATPVGGVSPAAKTSSASVPITTSSSQLAKAPSTQFSGPTLPAAATGSKPLVTASTSSISSVSTAPKVASIADFDPMSQNQAAPLGSTTSHRTSIADSAESRPESITVEPSKMESNYTHASSTMQDGAGVTLTPLQPVPTAGAPLEETKQESPRPQNTGSLIDFD